MSVLNSTEKNINNKVENEISMVFDQLFPNYSQKIYISV